jgi:hypothetical protein
MQQQNMMIDQTPGNGDGTNGTNAGTTDQTDDDIDPVTGFSPNLEVSQFNDLDFGDLLNEMIQSENVDFGNGQMNNYFSE